MQSFMITLLTCSVTMSALALVYMAITPLLTKRYSSKGRYYTWLIIVIGLVVPFRAQFNNPIIKMDMPSGEMATPIIQVGNGTPITVPMDNIALPPMIPNFSWWQIAVTMWLTGIITLLAYHMIKHYYFVKIAGRWSENITDEQALMLLQSLKTEIGISKRINLYLCSSVGSPMMVGLFNPRILLPRVDLTQEELRFVLKHELVHYKRKDLLYKYLVLIATTIHWFNPIVYLMAKEIDVLCEISCDAEIVRSTDINTRQHYTETIISIVKYRSKLKTSLSTNFFGGKKSMKKRIFSIMDISRKKAGIAILCCVLMLTLGTGFAFALNSTPTMLSDIANAILEEKEVLDKSTNGFKLNATPSELKERLDENPYLINQFFESKEDNEYRDIYTYSTKDELAEVKFSASKDSQNVNVINLQFDYAVIGQNDTMMTSIITSICNGIGVKYDDGMWDFVKNDYQQQIEISRKSQKNAPITKYSDSEKNYEFRYIFFSEFSSIEIRAIY